MRASATSLGLELKWRYHFLPPGTTVAPTRDAVFLDLGGQLCAGVIDQHQDGTLARCTAELVVRFPELVYGHLMTGWLDRRDAGQDLRGTTFSPVLVTHEHPDFDAMVGCWLVRRLVEDGDLPPEAEALAGYAAMVDQGEYAVDIRNPASATEAIHIAYLGIQSLRLGPSATIERGMALLDAVLGAVRAERGHLYRLGVADLLPPALRPESLRNARVVRAVASWRELPAFADVKALVDADLAKFASDEAEAEVSEVVLPAADGGAPIRVKTFIASGPTESVLNKYWVRARGYPYFVCPYGEGSGGVYPVVILSLDPNWREPGTGRRPTLRGLGLRLEQEEADVRRGKVALDRGLPPRWTDGTCDNADPWDDGRGHGHTIVWSPRAGTVLSYSEVCRIAHSRFWEVRLDQANVLVAIPVEGAARFEGGEHVPDRAEASPSLSAWLEDWRARETPRDAAPLPPPEGLEVVEDRQRLLPDTNCPPFRVLELRRQQSGAPTLDSVVRWLDDRNREHRGRIYTVAHVRFESCVAAIDDPGRLLGRLCAASRRAGATPGNPQGEDRDVVLYNGRAIALSDRGARSTRDRADLLLELLIYAAFQAEALQGYTKRIVEVLGGTGNGQHLREEFLRFHARYVHHDVVFDEGAREVYAGLRDALGLPEQHAKAIGDLDRLAEIERSQADRRAEEEKARADRKTDALIFLVGLAGIVQAGTVAFGEVPPLQNAAVAALLLLAATAYWRLTRGKPALPRPLAAAPEAAEDRDQATGDSRPVADAEGPSRPGDAEQRVPTRRHDSGST